MTEEVQGNNQITKVNLENESHCDSAPFCLVPGFAALYTAFIFLDNGYFHLQIICTIPVILYKVMQATLLLSMFHLFVFSLVVSIQLS